MTATTVPDTCSDNLLKVEVVGDFETLLSRWHRQAQSLECRNLPTIDSRCSRDRRNQSENVCACRHAHSAVVAAASDLLNAIAGKRIARGGREAIFMDGTSGQGYTGHGSAKDNEPLLLVADIEVPSTGNKQT